MPARATGLDSLPDDLLGACLGLLPQGEGKSVTLVCKRFRRLLYEQPGPWRRFEVPWASPKPDGYPAAKLALLRRVAPHVHEFVLCEEYTKRAWNRSPASFFRLLPSGLTGLKVRFHSAVPPAMAVLLRRLSALRSLCLWGHTLPAGLPDALQCQRHLEQLDIRMDECFDPDRLMAAVAQLSSLTQLSVVVLASSRLRPPAPTAFPRMAAFYILSDESPLELAGVQCRLCSVGPVQFSGEPLACLKLDELQHCESFAAFLAAAVPPSVALQALQLSDMRAEISAAALQGCTQLASVQCLELDFFHLDEAATAALLASTPRLTTLRLIGSWSTDLRALFVQPLPELHTLRLDSCPYSLPLELAQLTNLRRLELIRHGGMPSRNYQVLSSLPQLSTVAVDLQGTYQSAQVKMALEQHLPGVRIEPAA